MLSVSTARLDLLNVIIVVASLSAIKKGAIKPPFL